MVKLILAYRPPVDIVEFEEEYQLEHLALAEKIPNVRRMAVSLVAPIERGAEVPYHRMVEFYFDEQASLERALQSEAGKAALEHARVIASGGLDLMVAQMDRDF